MLTLEQEQKILEFVYGNNYSFYEQFLSRLSKSELENFLRENPDFVVDWNLEEK